MAVESRLLRTNWGSKDIESFVNKRVFIYDRESHVEVPRFVFQQGDTIIDQSMEGHGMFIEYRLFVDSSCTKLIDTVVYGPEDCYPKGISQEIEDRLSVIDAWTSEDGIDNGLRYIGYFIRKDGIELQDGSYEIHGDGTVTWEGTDTGPRPFVMGVGIATPIVRITGNKEELGADGEEHKVSGYRYEIDPVEQEAQAQILKELLKETRCNILPPPDTIEVSNYVDGVDQGPGTYTSSLVPNDFSLEGTIPGDSEWMNFRPKWDIQRQVTLVISGSDIYTGVGTPVSASKYYDGTPLMPDVKIPQNSTIMYRIDNGEWQREPAGVTDAGSAYVTVWIQVPGKDDQYAYYNLQVLPLPITLKSNSSSKYYDGLPLRYDQMSVTGVSSEIELVENRTYTLSLIGDDLLYINFIGEQTQVGSSQNSFNYTFDINRRINQSNYDIKAEFGVLQVNTNTLKRIVYIEGNSLEVPYDGQEHSVSGYRVSRITDEHGTLVLDYTPRDFEFIQDASGEVKSVLPIAKGTEINTISDESDPLYWTPVPYTSSLSEFNFRNTNSSFSDKNIVFEVTPNILTITRKPISVSVTGKNKEYIFNMVKDETTIEESYIPESHTVSGCIYAYPKGFDIDRLVYIKNGEICEPSITAAVWNENELSGKWYMELANDIHNDEDNPESGFKYTDKNYKVTLNLTQDGWLKISPLNVTVNIYGGTQTVEYDGESHRLQGTHNRPEIWWNSDCGFYNQHSKRYAKHYNKETLYRAEHGMGYFEWTDDGDTGAHTYINAITQITDPDYFTPIPYMMEMDITDFDVDRTSEFDTSLDYDNHIYKNFIVEFILQEEGWLLINSYAQPIDITIVGNHEENDYTGSEQSVIGFSAESDNELYVVDFVHNISFRDGQQPSQAVVSGTEPGTYGMGLGVKGTFLNVNRNFSDVRFGITDGYLKIREYGADQNVEYPNSINLIFTGADSSWDAQTMPGSSGVNLKLSEKQDPQSSWEEISGTVVDIPRDNMSIEVMAMGETSKTTTSGTIVITRDPLLIQISTGSQSWTYDGEDHSYDQYEIKCINSNLEDQSSADQISIGNYIVSHIQSAIENGTWTKITEPGSVQNIVTLSLDTILQKDLDSGLVIISYNYGILTVRREPTHVYIEGNKQSIYYDGQLHSLTGFTARDQDDNPVTAHLKHSFQYEQTIDQWEPGTYHMGLDLDSFESSEDFIIESVEDGELEIKKAPLKIVTGSATVWSFDLVEPLSCERYTATGLASTDTIEISGWPTITSGESENRPYNIRILNPRSLDDIYYTCYEVSEIWGKLVINEPDQGPFYRILGIRKEKSTEDNESQKLHFENLPKIDGLERGVDEDRFYPILHELVDSSENGEIEYNDIICLVPQIRNSKKISHATWMLENRSTGKKIYSQARTRPISPEHHQGEYFGKSVKYLNFGGLRDLLALDVRPQILEPGYYDVVFNYNMGGNEYSQRFSSVFMIKKH